MATLVLALRRSLQRALRELLRDVELRDALLLLVFALVLLPLAPDVRVGPYSAIHPPSLVRLLVVLLGINGLGHVALRLLGPRYGLPVAGLAGGFVSSSATIAAMSLRAKASPERCRGAIAGALASCVATGIQYLLIVASIDRRLLGTIALAVGTTVVVAAACASAFALRASSDGDAAPPAGKPLGLGAALLFVAVYCAVTILSSALHDRLGPAGIVLVSAAAGLIDAHSTAGSIAGLHLAGEVDASTALLASLAALSSNSVTKVALAWSGRHVVFGCWTTAGVLLIALSAWLTLWLH